MTTTVHPKRANGAGTAPLTGRQKAGAASKRRSRLPELVVGVALMVGGSLAAVLWHLSTTDNQAVLALAGPVTRGQVIEASDLRVVYLSSDDPIARLADSQAAEVVGRPARSDMAAGTLLTTDSVVSGPTLAEGEGVVGLALDPGQVPLSRLVPGDIVDVVAPADPATAPPGDGSVDGGAGAPSSTIASGASVYAVEEIGGQGKRFVSIKLPQAEANQVAAAAERGSIRLVLVGRP